MNSSGQRFRGKDRYRAVPPVFTTTWVLVADHGRARIFEKSGGTYQPIEYLTGPFKPEEKHREVQFTYDVAEKLNAYQKNERFQRLFLVAGPEFLGELRTHLDSNTNETVTGSANKDLAWMNDEDVAKRLLEMV